MRRNATPAAQTATRSAARTWPPTLAAHVAAGLAALGWPLALTPVVREAALHVPAGTAAWMAAAALCGAALGFWLPRRVLLSRMIAGGESRAPPHVSPEFAASAAGALLAALGLVWLALALLTPALESIRFGLLDAFAWPARLVGAVAALILAIPLALAAAISAVTIIVLHGWQRLLNAAPRPVRSLWLALLAPALAGVGVALAMEPRLLASLATAATFAAAAAAVALPEARRAVISCAAESPRRASRSAIVVAGGAATLAAVSIAGVRNAATATLAAALAVIAAVIVMRSAATVARRSTSVSAAIAGVGAAVTAMAAASLVLHLVVSPLVGGAAIGVLAIGAALGAALLSRDADSTPRSSFAWLAVASAVLLAQTLLSRSSAEIHGASGQTGRPCVATILPELPVLTLGALLAPESVVSLWNLDEGPSDDSLIVDSKGLRRSEATDRLVDRLVSRALRGARGLRRRVVLWPAGDEQWLRAVGQDERPAWLLTCGGPTDEAALLLGPDVPQWIAHAANDPDLRTTLREWRTAAPPSR